MPKTQKRAYHKNDANQDLHETSDLQPPKKYTTPKSVKSKESKFVIDGNHVIDKDAFEKEYLTEEVDEDATPISREQRLEE